MIQYPLLTSMNSVRLIHGAGPLVTDETITKKAQEWANKIAASDKEGIDTDSPYGALICSRVGGRGRGNEACQSWYTTIKHHNWCRPQASGNAGPFMNMIWNNTNRIGIGISKASDTKYYVVAYFSPKREGELKRNVRP
ncbi:predicted protein, partial [Nematostella vectensis]